ncbi:lytic transglycosylase domain-containing protein [Streptomyces sp. SL13]|uniref:Lytic transglycosylase domain-containing protein n=1 Tax=Streptantibioticus silvisoli TaxID=2705255 RepID=A0AA90KG24_9ACTN|nr:lytic transglycosylase domain-containing protein [Streptantibioticus silvisoli]MDI5964002.1 lytic transglycosylase domain-containing protein [Streptantibioticus silvisoli]MDI5970035.1 lytic transglycosylase domain-containing protein [Streptantibioticus silvisoli]
MSRISVRGIAVASATAVTTVGAVVGMASGSDATAAAAQPVADSVTLDSIASAQQADAMTASLTEQAQTQQAEAEATAKKQAEEAARKQAAAEAAKKKAEAEAAAKAKAEAAAAKAKAQKIATEAAATGNYSVSAVQAMAQQIVGNATQYQCFSWIVSRESGWNYRATNASSGAYGLVQALPGSKMSSAGADWQTNPATQIKWGMSYMNSRYGSPCGAQQFWEANGWY